jgi:hypothetical protein
MLIMGIDAVTAMAPRFEPGTEAFGLPGGRGTMIGVPGHKQGK